MKRPPYLLREKTRHGKIVWYFRRDDGPRIRIHGEYGSKEFMANYRAALSGASDTDARPAARASSDSLAWLVSRYRESSAWTQKLSVETRRTREGLLRQLESVDRPYTSITKRDIKLALDKRADKPSMADHFLKTARGLFGWAVDVEYLNDDPTQGIHAPQYESDGYHPWTEEEVVAFEKRWPIGTRERLALAILLYTGFRRGDASRLGRQHVKDGVISIKTEKTGAWVTIPLVSELASIMDATKLGTLAFVAKENGAPMTKRYFGNWFKDAATAAGVPGTCHGLRKAGARRLAEAGATLHELNAIFGWTGTEMASLYTDSADRKRLAASGIAKLKKNAE